MPERPGEPMSRRARRAWQVSTFVVAITLINYAAMKR